jgi:primosomal replication protein N
VNIETTNVPKKYEDAIAHWVKHNFQDLPILEKYWDKYFPSDDKFCLCAKMDLSTSRTQDIGDHAGQPKAEDPTELSEEQARQMLGIIRAQASTEFGSIQQHQVTLERSPSDQDKFWVLRVMAEELRHGYQMFHMLTSRNWEHLSGGVKTEDMVEDVLQMETGTHVLEAFNLPYDSFIDNVVFGKQAESCSKFLNKGSSVLVEGRLQEKRWESNGQQKSKFEVIAQSVRFLSRRGGGQEAATGGEMDIVPPEETTDLEPF